MRISKSEMTYLVGLLISRDGLTESQAKKRILDDNGHLKELTSKIRKKRNRKKKEDIMNFSKKFREFKEGNDTTRDRRN